MEEIRIRFQDLAKGVKFEFRTGRQYRLVIELMQVEIYVHDVFRQPLPGAPFQLRCGTEYFEGKADGGGKVVVKLKNPAEKCNLRWSGDLGADPADFEYEREIYFDFHQKDSSEGHKRRLHNLGLPSMDEVELAIGLFQVGWDLEPTGRLDARTIARIDQAVREPVAHDDEEPADSPNGDDAGERT